MEYEVMDAGLRGLRCVDEKTAAGLLSVSVHTLRAWRGKNRGPRYVKVAGAVRHKRGVAGRVAYRLVDLVSFLEATTVPTDFPDLTRLEK